MIRVSPFAKRTAAHIGNRLRVERMSRGWSHREMADRCGIAHSNLARMESGLHEPKISTLIRISDALSLPVSHWIQELTYKKNDEQQKTPIDLP